MDVILGTAGHIDHGKTALVNALTGIDCDRLEEEKRRGITIELGFAWMDLPDGRILGIVDVPGHERFVKNMVAGASGMDCVLLVIAADEGVMPQTAEHLEICSLLGVKTGLVALTKTDLVDQEWLNMVREDIQEVLAGTFLSSAPIVPVSAATGEGLQKLREEIFTRISAIKPVTGSDILRLPADRVFTMKGFGPVVTGTIISGDCRTGENVCVVPKGGTGRIRNLQVHNTQVDSAHAGQRCAMNLQGLEVEDIQRGDVIARPNTLFPSGSWFIRLHCLKSSPLPIRQRMEVHFHHGARECQAKILMRDRERLEPGQTAIAEVKFDLPLAAVYGDRCVLRAHSPLRAIGGGIVFAPLPPALNRRKKEDFAKKYAALRELGEPDKAELARLSPKPPETLVGLALALRPLQGATQNQLQVMTGLSRTVLVTALKNLEKNGEALCWDASQGFWTGGESVRECLEKATQRAQELHRREPLKSFFAPGSLTVGWGDALPPKFLQGVFNLAVREGLLIQEGAGLRLAGHETSLDAGAAAMLDVLRSKLKNGGIAPPFAREILEENGWDPKKLQAMLNHLCERGEALKIQDGVYYDKNEFTKMTDKIREWFRDNPELDIGDFKTLLGISRKYAIPVLEYLDSIRLTIRIGDRRRLRQNQG